MLTLGLDPSLSSYGWCIYDGTKAGLDKVVARGRIHTSSKELEVARYLQIKTEITKLIVTHDIKRASVETPPQGMTGAWSQEKLYALFIANLEVMYTQRVNIVLFAPTQLQLLAKIWGSGTIQGEWFKSDMQEQYQADVLELLPQPRHADYFHKTAKRLDLLRGNGYYNNPFPIVDVSEHPVEVRKKLRINNDEADAYHLGRFGDRFWRFIGGELTEDDLTPSEWDVFARRHTFTRGAKKGTTEYYGVAYKEGARFFRFATSTDFVPSK